MDGYISHTFPIHFHMATMATWLSPGVTSHPRGTPGGPLQAATLARQQRLSVETPLGLATRSESRKWGPDTEKETVRIEGKIEGLLEKDIDELMVIGQFTGQLRGEVLFANFLWDKKNKTNLKASLLFSQAEDRDRWGVDCQSQHKIILFTWYYIMSRSHHAMFLQKESWTEMISRYASHCWNLKMIKRTIHKSQEKQLGFCWLLATLSSLMAVSHLGRCCITHK